MGFWTWWFLGIVVGMTLLTVLFTGPGMWSEKWGWKWLEDKKPPKPSQPDRAEEPAETKRG